MLWVFFARYIYFPLSSNNFAVPADCFYGCANFHIFLLLASIYDAASLVVVWTLLNGHGVARENANFVNPEFPGNIRQKLATVVKFNSKLQTWQGLKHLSNFAQPPLILLCHVNIW